MFARILAALAMVTIAPSAYAVGEDKSGFPNWAERVEHEWTNRARVEPALEMTKCGAMRCPDAACYTPQPPLYWNEQLNHSARFHSIHMRTNGYFAHDSNCALSMSLNTTYPTTCNGAAGCSCAGAGTTSPSVRTAIFGAGYSGEIIASPGDPDSAFYLWLYETTSSATCAFSLSNGHRWLLLTAAAEPSASASMATPPATSAVARRPTRSPRARTIHATVGRSSCGPIGTTQQRRKQQR